MRFNLSFQARRGRGRPRKKLPAATVAQLVESRVRSAAGYLGRSVRNSLALLGFVSAATLAYQLNARRKRAALLPDEPASSVLEIRLDRLTVTEREPEPSELLRDALTAGGRRGDEEGDGEGAGEGEDVAGIRRQKISLRQLADVIDRAAADPRVTSLLTVGDDESASSVAATPLAGGGNLAGVQELRDAFARFRATGKPTLYYADSFGETVPYYLATSHESVYMQPTGSLGLVGLSAGGLFLRGALDKLGVKPVAFSRHEYKTAANMFSERAFTGAHRETTDALLDSLYDTLVTAVAESRRTAAAAVQCAVDHGPLIAPEALNNAWVDGTCYRTEMRQLVRGAVTNRLQERRGLRRAAAQRVVEAVAENGSKSEMDAAAFLTAVDEWITTRPWEDAAAPSMRATEWEALRESVRRLEHALSAEDAKARDNILRALKPQLLALARAAAAEPADAVDGAATAAAADEHSPSDAPHQRDESEQRKPLKFVSLTDYRQASEAARPWRLQMLPFVARERAQNVIALVHVTGPIDTEAAREAAHALTKASRDESVKAVVLRVSSPGGGIVPSDTLRHAVQQCRKPVIACMGNVAASGGYMCSAPCARIVAEPGTITGSIGVVFLRFNLAELAAKYGVGVDSVSRGANADVYDGLRGAVSDFTEAQRARLDMTLDWYYRQFCEVVGRGRGMEHEAVERVARGRVWSGRDALRHGLVDRLGGLYEAVQEAKAVAQIPDWEQVRVVAYPPTGVLAQLRGLGVGGGGGGVVGGERACSALYRRLAAVAMESGHAPCALSVDAAALRVQ